MSATINTVWHVCAGLFKSTCCTESLTFHQDQFSTVVDPDISIWSVVDVNLLILNGSHILCSCYNMAKHNVTPGEGGREGGRGGGRGREGGGREGGREGRRRMSSKGEHGWLMRRRVGGRKVRERE